jgi:hypothetical protein
MQVRERLSTGSTSSMSRAPLLLRLADLPSVGISLEQFTNNSALHFNHDKAVWEGNDEGVDLTGFPDETSPIERWDDEFEFLNDIKLSGYVSVSEAVYLYVHDSCVDMQVEGAHSTAEQR